MRSKTIALSLFVLVVLSILLAVFIRLFVIPNKKGLIPFLRKVTDINQATDWSMQKQEAKDALKAIQKIQVVNAEDKHKAVTALESMQKSLLTESDKQKAIEALDLMQKNNISRNNNTPYAKNY